MCRWAYFIAATLVACATAAVGVDEDGHRVHVKPRAGANLRGTVDAKDPPGSNGYCPHHKLVDNPMELTACSAAGKCDPVSDAMTREESYECLGQHWDMPDEPKPADSEQIPRVVHLVLSDHGRARSKNRRRYTTGGGTCMGALAGVGVTFSIIWP